MPTRIVVNTNTNPLPPQVPSRQEVKKYPNVLLATENKSYLNRSGASHRRSSGFRSSILRELSVRVDTSSDALGAHSRDKINISSGDIRASTRIFGYLSSAIAGAVLLVSVIRFYQKEIVPINTNTTEKDQFFQTGSGDLIFRWKLWGAIWASSALVGSCILIMLAHFDTIFFPNVWVAFFRDGSRAERNLILAIVISWMPAIHICTSSLSVGSVQANVYFTSWIAFASLASTYGNWREGAGLHTILDMMNQHKRETTYNWFWIMFFSCVFAGAITDIYWNRDQIKLQYDGELLNLQGVDWIIIFSLFWGDVAVCLIAILLNEWWVKSSRLPCSCRGKSGTYRCVLGWRQLEGFVIALSVLAKFVVIWKFTGVDNVINGLSNAYFGIWGSFFNAVFALGTWLKENKNTEFIVRDDDNDAYGSDGK